MPIDGGFDEFGREVAGVLGNERIARPSKRLKGACKPIEKIGHLADLRLVFVEGAGFESPVRRCKSGSFGSRLFFGLCKLQGETCSRRTASATTQSRATGEILL
jgi:hypothetical protein